MQRLGMDWITMKRGEIYFADLDPTVGHETRKRRPVLIVSNNANNQASATLTVVPITSNTAKTYPFEVFLDAKETGLMRDSKAQCQQIRTISKQRIKQEHAVGRVTRSLSKINAALVLHLDL